MFPGWTVPGNEASQKVICILNSCFTPLPNKVQENKKVKKGVGMACQKLCMQDRDDIKVKSNIESSIPASFYTTVHLSVKKM